MAKRVYSDLNLNFDRHPLTGDIVKAYDVEAIKKSLRNLIQLNLYECPFNPEKGSSIRAMLFENFSPITTEFLKSKIQELVKTYEVRVDIQKVIIYQKDDQNALEVSIYFKIVEFNLSDDISIFVERTR